MNWSGTVVAIIAQVAASLPADADLKARKRALTAAKPHEFSSTSWGRKVWAKEARKYLEKHGLPPLHPKPAETYLSPLERAKFKALARSAEQQRSRA